MNKTICFFNSNRAWGGGEKWHFTTAKEFERRGYKTFIVTNPGSELEKKAHTERLDFIPYRVSNLSFLNPIKLLVLAIMFRVKKVDAVVLNLPSDLKLAGLAAKIAGVKKIIYRRGMPHPLRNTWLNRFLFQKILTHIVVNSKEIGRSLKGNNESWFPEDKMVLIYNGIDTSKSIHHGTRTYQKKRNEIVIGNAGRLTEQKGQKYLIELAQTLKKNDVDFVILIAGEGELKSALENEISQKMLKENVILLGHVNDMTPFFDSLDFFVFTSLYEGSANTLIETLWHEVPTIAWNLSSNPEIIQHEVTGFLVNFADVDAMSNLIRNHGDLKTITGNGVEFVRRNFDTHQNLNILESIIEN